MKVHHHYLPAASPDDQYQRLCACHRRLLLKLASQPSSAIQVVKSVARAG